MCAWNPIPSDQRYQPECDGDGHGIGRSNCDGTSYWLWCYWYLLFESHQVLMVSGLCCLPLFSMWQMVSLYYALPKEKESDCQKFKLSVQLIPGQINRIHFLFERRVKYEKDVVSPAEAFLLDLQPSLDWSRKLFKIKFCGPAVSIRRRPSGTRGAPPDFFIIPHLCVTNKLKPYHPGSFVFAFSYLSFRGTHSSEKWIDWMVKEMLLCLQIKEMKMRGCTSWE